MRASVLERVLHVDRARPKSGAWGATAPPIVMRIPTEPESAPHVTSLSNGTFTLTRMRDGEVGQAFSVVNADDEDALLGRLFSTLCELSKKGWTNRVRTIPEAIVKLENNGFSPRHLIVPYSSIELFAGSSLTSDETDKVTLAQGCVVEVDGIRVLSARCALPEGVALLTTTRPLAGYYTRISDSVAVTLCRVDRAWVLVTP